MQRNVFQWWRTECRADCFMEANYCNWFWHFKAATLYTFMTSKQCRGMYCQGGGVGRGAGRCLKKLMSRNIWWGGHRWPERMSAMSRPYGVPPTPTPSLTNLRLSLCPHSGSFYNMTLKDDGSRGGCTDMLKWFPIHTAMHHVCHLSFSPLFLSSCGSERLSEGQSVAECHHHSVT